MNRNTNSIIRQMEVNKKKMRNITTIVLTVAMLILIPSSTVYASSQSASIPAEDEPCVFTANIDRSVRMYTDRIQVFGFVHPNCDTHDLWESYKVNVKVVDMNGKVIKDNWKPEARLHVDEDQRPSLYEVDANIQEVGVRLVWDKMNEKNHKVWPNQYYVVLPILNSVHFEKLVVYAVEVSYGNMIISNNFIIIG